MKLKFYVGVDISKDTLDICFLDKSTKKTVFYKIPNNTKSIESLFQIYKSDEICVCFETTANYNVSLAKYLYLNKIVYSELNPYKSSLFLRHLTNIKTDITDSYGLALYCSIFKNDLIESKFNSKYKLIKSYISTHKLLTKIQTQIKNFEKSQIDVNDDVLRSVISDMKKGLRNLLKKLDDICYELLKDEIPQTDEILKNSKGIGKSLAISLFPILHFNKDKSSKQIISYLGLKPKTYESGISVKKNPHITKTGNNEVRKMLFLSALSCIRFNPHFKERYEKLISNGKPKKVAIVAVMCAIIRYLKSYYFSENNNYDVIL